MTSQGMKAWEEGAFEKKPWSATGRFFTEFSWKLAPSKRWDFKGTQWISIDFLGHTLPQFLEAHPNQSNHLYKLSVFFFVVGYDDICWGVAALHGSRNNGNNGELWNGWDFESRSSFQVVFYCFQLFIGSFTPPPQKKKNISNGLYPHLAQYLRIWLRWFALPRTIYIYIQVEPGKPGAEVSKGKNYKPTKEFAYRMCTGWPTTAMPKPSCLSERAFSRSMVVMWWPVLMWLVAGSDEVMRLVVRWREVR